MLAGIYELILVGAHGDVALARSGPSLRGVAHSKDAPEVPPETITLTAWPNTKALAPHIGDRMRVTITIEPETKEKP